MANLHGKYHVPSEKLSLHESSESAQEAEIHDREFEIEVFSRRVSGPSSKRHDSAFQTICILRYNGTAGQVPDLSGQI